jgi:type I restriction enzyme S subunit
MVTEETLLKQKGPQQFHIPSRWINQEDSRLDASHYTSRTIWALMLTKESGFDVATLGNRKVTQEMFNLGRFKRIYTPDPQQGWPYLSATEVFMLRPQSERWIVRSKAPKTAERYFVESGWILMSCSGVIGRPILASRRLEKYFITHDLMRVIPSLPSGYLFAFFSSWVGQTLIKQQQYGATVTHIEPHHLERIPVPLLPKQDQDAIHEQIAKAYGLRDEANDLLDKAESLIYGELRLPPFDQSKVPYLFGVIKPKAFTTKASALDDRLDASYHVPRLKAALSVLKDGKYPTVTLGELADPYVPPRFKRIYVEPEYGIPFLQGSHVPMVKPFDLKFLSRRAHANLEPWIIKAGWALVTCSGTIGRIAMVPKAWEGWAASQHIERIIPKGENHAGYIAAFLMTPYGQIQLSSKIYGGVVDELTEGDTVKIIVPKAPIKLQSKIGSLVMDAYEKSSEANQEEDQAVARFEAVLERSFVEKGYVPFKPRGKTLQQALEAARSANWGVPEEEVQADVEEAIRSVSKSSEQA